MMSLSFQKNQDLPRLRGTRLLIVEAVVTAGWATAATQWNKRDYFSNQYSP
jgi:hypothetical protein